MYEIPCENYESIKKSLKEMLEQLKKMSDDKKIIIKGKQYNLKFMLGGDLKFIAIIFGLNAANSDYPCPWCTCDISKPVDLNQRWPISRTQRLAAELLQNISINEEESLLVENRFGQKLEPIINFIEFDSCIVDILHLLLTL